MIYQEPQLNEERKWIAVNNIESTILQAAPIENGSQTQ
jgi:hypothetical protein